MKKVLVVDDDYGVQDALVEILKSENHVVEALSRGDHVLETIYTFKPDVILLDVMLGGMDGREICKQIKQNSKTKDIRVIMISATHNLSDTAARNGADDFIPKPFDMYDLLEKVENAA